MESLTLPLRPATADDRPLLVSLLQQADLPTDDLPAELTGFVLALEGDRLAGSAGLEVWGDTGLLRSVAVHPAYQGRQLGRRLAEEALETARQRGVRQVYLITTTADGYFGRLGFGRVGREDVPQAIARTRQFRGLCPASAVVMKKQL